MKRLILSIYILTITLALSAQSLVSFGGRGGFDFMVPGSDQKIHGKFGVAGAVDLGYTFYWHVESLHFLGIHTGLSAGYATNESLIALDEKYTNYDYLNNALIYNTTGKTHVAMKRAYAEVPIMAAYRHRNIIAQLGLKVQYSFQSSTTQEVKEASVDAYFPAYDVHVTDKLITGIVNEEDFGKRSINVSAPPLNLILAMKVGYEFRFKKKHILGLAAYMDFNIWNNMNLPRLGQPHIAVAPISNPLDPVPAVTVNNAFHTIINHINPIQIGVSVYYALEFRLYSSFKSAQYEWDH